MDVTVTSDSVDSLLEDSSEDSSESPPINVGIEWKAIPYSKLYQQLQPLDKDLPRLVPGCKIHVSVHDLSIKNKRCWYTILLEHSHFKWSIQKTYREILQFHRQLQIYRAFLKLQLPDIRMERDPLGRRRLSSVSVHSNRTPKLPTFPREFSSSEDGTPLNTSELELYLQRVLAISKFRNFRETLELLEISPLSFVDELGPKQGEGFVYRAIHIPDNWIGFCICNCWLKKRWLFIKDSFVGLLNHRRGRIEYVLLVDHGFRVKVGKEQTRHSEGISIENLCGNLYLKCNDRNQARLWDAALHELMASGPSDFFSPNKYNSFAPVRPLTECKWIVDGATYFEAVAEALEKARHEIFIADWWLSPEIYMKRPTVQGHYWQLDYILKRKARAGVRIYVLLYKEVELSLGLNSYHSEQKLKHMHRNIKVLRHPQMSKGVLFWSHHEKIVCIDQTYAFVGGLDLCYGRWDDYQHRLSDFGEFEDKLKIMRHKSMFYSERNVPTEEKPSTSVPIIEYVADAPTEAEGEEESAPEDNLKDIKHSTSIPKCSSFSDLPSVRNETLDSKRFKRVVEKYNTFQAFHDIKRKLSLEARMDDTDLEMNQDYIIPSDRRRTVQEIALMVLGIERKYRLWHGKDYVNFITKDFEHLEQPYSDIIDRTTTPRMPWHDIGLFVQGKAARDIARHFILRWNHTKAENHHYDTKYPYLMPKSSEDFEENVPTFLQDTIGTIFRAECQVLRSLSYWSGNLSETEMSIHDAYIDVITESKHFIYIENQFFISQRKGDRPVSNGIADALFQRISRAYRSGTPFHVYVVLPLLPAFEGEIGTGSGTCIQTVMNWHYKSICRGPSSLYERLRLIMKDPSMYISFYGLRTHGTLNKTLVTELVYVHSKMLIADDQVCLIGSANLNDRSLMGQRDSEIAVLVRDTQFHEIPMPHKAGKFCFSLRTALFREHLGLMSSSQEMHYIRDPSNIDFIKNVWKKTAMNNSRIYEEVFQCQPSDNVHSFQQMKVNQRKPVLAVTNPDEAKEKLKEVQGYLVTFPLNFLCNEKLEPNLSTKEGLLPVWVWT